MKKPVTLIAVGALLAAFSATTVLSQDEPPLMDDTQPAKTGGSTGGRIAVIDIGRALLTYERGVEIERQVRTDFEKLDASFSKEFTGLEAEYEELQTLRKGTEQYLRRKRELDLRRMTLDYDSKNALEMLRGKERYEKIMLYQAICDEGAVYGKSKGLDAVLLTVSLSADIVERGDPELLISTRAVLWHDERLDITDEIVRRLNERHAAAKAKSGGDGEK